MVYVKHLVLQTHVHQGEILKFQVEEWLRKYWYLIKRKKGKENKQRPIKQYINK